MSALENRFHIYKSPLRIRHEALTKGFEPTTMELNKSKFDVNNKLKDLSLIQNTEFIQHGKNIKQVLDDR